MYRTMIVVGLLAVLSACGDPLGGLTRLSDVRLAETDATAQALPTQEEIAREGFFGTTAADAADAAAAPDPDPVQRRGLLGVLRRAAAPAATDEAPQAATETADGTVADAPITDAAALPDAQPAPRRDGVDAQDVPYGTLLPYGTVARVCEAGRKPLGRKIESAVASGYKLYDSDPDAAGLRTFYITGFDDGCPRQVTAAHVLLGEPSFYEQLRYGPAGQHLPLGETDAAYEKIKSGVCGVGRGKPCGSRMRQLERGTFFVNTYERVDDNAHWSELLVHDGVVVAAALKTSG